jgi:hypothetical protein
MTCDFRDDVAAQLLGGVPPAEALRIDQHVLGCDTCAGYRRQMTIVRTLLDGADRDLLDPTATPGSDLPDPPEPQLTPRHADETIHRMLQARHEHRQTGRLVPFLAGVAAAVLVGVLPLAGYAWTHRSDDPASIELVGTAAAPGAWGEVTLHSRVDGTIVDFEAGNLPRDPGRYQVTVKSHDTVLAQQDLTVSTDGWGQIVLATTQPLERDYTITVTRRDGPRLTPVLTCRCRA